MLFLILKTFHYRPIHLNSDIYFPGQCNLDKYTSTCTRFFYYLQDWEPKQRRQHLIARLPNIKQLNGSKITDTERDEAERAFIRFFMDSNEKPARQAIYSVFMPADLEGINYNCLFFVYKLVCPNFNLYHNTNVLLQAMHFEKLYPSDPLKRSEGQSSRSPLGKQHSFKHIACCALESCQFQLSPQYSFDVLATSCTDSPIMYRLENIIVVLQKQEIIVVLCPVFLLYQLDCPHFQIFVTKLKFFVWTDRQTYGRTRTNLNVPSPNRIVAYKYDNGDTTVAPNIWTASFSELVKWALSYSLKLKLKCHFIHFQDNKSKILITDSTI